MPSLRSLLSAALMAGTLPLLGACVADGGYGGGYDDGWSRPRSSAYDLDDYERRRAWEREREWQRQREWERERRFARARRAENRALANNGRCDDSRYETSNGGRADPGRDERDCRRYGDGLKGR